MDAPDFEIQGCWNAFVESGASKDERRARFAACPEPLKAGVMSHLKTVAAVRDAAKNRSLRKRLEGS